MRLFSAIFIFSLIVTSGVSVSAEAKAPEKRRFVAASSNNFPPVNVLNDKGELIGFGRDLSAAVISAIGGSLTYIHSSSWTDVLKWVASGKADFIHDTGLASERLASLDYTDPILEMKEQIFVSSERTDIKGFGDLSGKKVACVNQRITHIYLKTFSDINCVVVKKPVDGIWAIINGDADAFVYPREIAIYFIQYLKLAGSIEIVGDPVRSLKWHMTVRKGNKDMVQLLNLGISRVRANGEYDKIYKKWFGQTLLMGYSTQTTFLFVGGAILISLLGCGLVFAIMYAHEVKKSKNRLEMLHLQKAEAESALKQSERRYQDIVDNQWELVSRFSPDGKRTFMNKAYLQFLGKSEKEMLGRHITEVVHPGDVTKLQGYVEKLSIDSPTTELETRVLHHDGEYRYLHWLNRAIFDDDGQLLEVQCSGRDVTDRKMNEAKRLELEEQLRQSQKLQTIGTLANGIAHDFNNILSPIVGYVDLALLDLPEDSQTYKNLVRVRGATDRAKSLVRKILSIAGHSEQEQQPVQIAEVAQEAVELLRPTLPKRIEIKLELDEACLPVHADQEQIHQVVMNLCTNAYQEMGDDCGTLTIRTEMVAAADVIPGRDVSKDWKFVRLCVGDTGAGMTPSQISRIFEPFYTTKEVGKGVGLGLSVAQGIIAAHGGTITVDSMPGEGSVFYVCLPAMEAEAAEKSVSPGVKVAMENSRVLYVDDEEDIAEMGKQMLERIGFHVTAVAGGGEALDLFQANPDGFDIIVTDHNMPRMTGIQLAQEISSLKPNMPIILMTGSGEIISGAWPERKLFSGFLMKPIVIHELSSAVRDAIKASRGP